MVGVAITSVLLVVLIVAFPTVPEVARESATFFGAESWEFDDVTTHPNQGANTPTNVEKPARGAWLAGTIEELPEKPANRVAERLIEPTEIRRK